MLIVIKNRHLKCEIVFCRMMTVIFTKAKKKRRTMTFLMTRPLARRMVNKNTIILNILKILRE